MSSKTNYSCAVLYTDVSCELCSHHAHTPTHACSPGWARAGTGSATAGRCERSAPARGDSPGRHSRRRASDSTRPASVRQNCTRLPPDSDWTPCLSSTGSQSLTDRGRKTRHATLRFNGYADMPPWFYSQIKINARKKQNRTRGRKKD